MASLRTMWDLWYCGNVDRYSAKPTQEGPNVWNLKLQYGIFDKKSGKFGE